MVIIGGLVAVTPFVPDDDKVIVYAVAVVVGTLAQLLYLLPSLRGLARSRSRSASATRWCAGC